MIDYMGDQTQRAAAESALAHRIAQWKGEDAVDLVRELNAIAVMTYFAKRQANG